jgi:hypothetical protein
VARDKTLAEMMATRSYSLAPFCTERTAAAASN